MDLSPAARQHLFTAGYTTKGVIYVLIGGFAVASIVGIAAGTAGPKGVIEWIGTNPFGQVLLGLTGLGLLAYALLRWYTAVFDRKNEGTDAKGITKRIAWAISGTSYGVLAVFAFRQLFGGNGGSGGMDKQDMISRLLEPAYGQWLVGIVAVIFGGVACYQLYRAVTDKHMKHIEGQRVSDEVEDTFRRTGRVGLIARFVVFGIIAYFLLRAALSASAGKFKGTAEAIASLKSNDYGSSLVIIVGVGLIAYGLFMFVRARYERV